MVHTDEFGEWWDALSADEQEDVARVIIPRAERIWKEYLDEQAKGLHEEKP